MSNLEVKAHRIARDEDAITIAHRENDYVAADIVGDSAIYRVQLTPGGSRCECVAFTVGHRVCSHIKALHLYEAYGAIWQAERRARIREASRNCRK